MADIAMLLMEKDAEIERLRAALEELFNDCLASDFNEHWNSYLRAKDELGK